MEGIITVIVDYFKELYVGTVKENTRPRMVLREFQDALKGVAAFDTHKQRAVFEGYDCDPYFLYECSLDVARRLYKHPYLMYHGMGPIETKRNQLELERIVDDAVVVGLWLLNHGP